MGVTPQEIMDAITLLEAAINAGADLGNVLQKLASKQPITLDEVKAAAAQTQADIDAERKEIGG